MKIRRVTLATYNFGDFGVVTKQIKRGFTNGAKNVIYIHKKHNGPRTLLWGTPDITGKEEDNELVI